MDSIQLFFILGVSECHPSNYPVVEVIVIEFLLVVQLVEAIFSIVVLISSQYFSFT